MATRPGAAAVNWDDVRLRLEKSRLAIDGVASDDRAAQEAVLRERVVELAKSRVPESSPASAEDGIEVLVFGIAGERYAFETRCVGQLYPVAAITPVPGVPDWVVGITAVRGEVLSVIDLRSLLDMPVARLQDPTTIIVLQSDAMEFGILAEEILGVERHAPQTLERALPTLNSLVKTVLKGITSDRTAILDADRLLADPLLVVEAG